MANQKFKELLNKRDLRATSPRLDLLSHLEEYASAMPYSKIQSAMESVDRVTLYRTLDTLIQKGIIHKAHQENNETFYAMCGEGCRQHEHHHDHIHFKCLRCLRVTCEHLNNSLKISLPDHEIRNISVQVEGICQNCQFVAG